MGLPNSFIDTSDDVARHERAVITASRLGEVLHDLTLSHSSNCAVAVERRQDALMPKVLAPSLELLRGLAQCFAELGQCVPKAVWIEIRVAGRLKEAAASGRSSFKATTESAQ
jgi:hypothetical protein